MGGMGGRGRYGVLTPTTPATRLGVQQRHLPHDEAAPVVADEDGPLDAQVVEQADQVTGEVGHVVVGHRLGSRAGAVAALVGGDGPEAGVGHRR